MKREKSVDKENTRKGAARSSAKRARSGPLSDSSVYDGSVRLGTIKGSGGVYKARMAGGQSLGDFKSGIDAMRAILAARRLPKLRGGE